MPSVTLSYTSTGGSIAGSLLGTTALPVFGGSGTLFNVDYTASPVADAIYNEDVVFRRSSTSTDCWFLGISLVSGDTSKTNYEQVGNPPAQWHCYDWDTLVWSMNGASGSPGTGIVLTLTIRWPDPSALSHLGLATIVG